MELINNPHGGKLVYQALTGEERQEMLGKAEKYPKILLTTNETNELELIATGAFSPLNGFMGKEDYLSVLKRNCLSNNVLWTIPITLNVLKDTAQSIKNNSWVALTDQVGKVIATMYVTEKFELDRELEIQLLYQSRRTKQADLEQLYQDREFALGGEIWLVNRPGHAIKSSLRLEPAEMRERLRQLGWRRTIAFQTPNLISHSNDSVEKCALEIVDGLFWQPQLCEAKMGKRMIQKKLIHQQEMLEQFYPSNKIISGFLPWVSRQAGPREAVLEAIVRKNYGCTHYIVAEKQYRMYHFYNFRDFRRIFDEVSLDDLGIIPIFAEETFYCRRCGKVVTSQLCPHERIFNEIFNPIQQNEMLSKSQIPPLEFSGELIFPFLADKLWNENHLDSPLPGDGLSELNPKLQRLVDNC